MRRGLWFVAGAGVGVYAMVRGRRAAEALTAEGLHDRWQALGVGARLFRAEVAGGKAEAEASLRERFGPRGLETRGLETRGLPSPGEGYSTNELTTREGSSTHQDSYDHDSRNEEGPQ